MDLPIRSAEEDADSPILWEEERPRLLPRMAAGRRRHQRSAVLAVLPAAEHPPPATLDRLAHEFGLKDELDAAWAARPLELWRERGRTMLMLEDPGGEPLDRLLGAPMEMGRFLRLASAIAAAVGGMHRAASSTRTSSRRISW